MGYIPSLLNPSGIPSLTGYALTSNPYTTTSTNIRRPSMATNTLGVDAPLTRRQFFARIRKLGFSKSGLQMARNGLTYRKDTGSGFVLVTVPKGHESTFTITGNVPYSGIFVKATNPPRAWGTQVVPEDLYCHNMLEVCLDLLSGVITVGGDG
jgi:hypothetical protein